MAEGTLLLLAFAVVFTGIICAVGVTLFLSIYKELISLRKKVKSSWRKIDSILKQRQEELPRLLQLVKECVGHKQVILEKVDHSRTRFESARRLEEKIKTSNEVTQALQSLFAMVEAYPELKKNQDFLKLQKQFMAFHYQIEKCKSSFNEQVVTFNTKVEQMPDSLFAKILGYKELDCVVADNSDQSISNLNIAA